MFPKLISFSKKLSNLINQISEDQYYHHLLSRDMDAKDLPIELCHETYHKNVDALFKYVRQNSNHLTMGKRTNNNSNNNNNNNNETEEEESKGEKEEFWRALENSGRLKKSSSWRL